MEYEIICANGLYPARSLDVGNSKILPDEKEIASCVEFIREFVVQRKTINKTIHSYSMKHRVERWTVEAHNRQGLITTR